VTLIQTDTVIVCNFKQCYWKVCKTSCLLKISTQYCWKTKFLDFSR